MIEKTGVIGSLVLPGRAEKTREYIAEICRLGGIFLPLIV